MTPDRTTLLADDTLTGSRWCRAHSDLVDQWLVGLFARALEEGGNPAGYALVAVGGYGRSELCPNSDIDVMLVHDRRPGVAQVADRIWYPVWDEGFHLGHSVTTVGEVLALAADDLDTATALLSARHVAGDAKLSAAVATAGHDQWQKRSKRWLAQLAARVDERHHAAGEVAFQLEPDLKDGRGGMRDVHSLRWAEAAQPVLLPHDAANLEGAYAVVLDARVELQRVTGRSANILALQEQTPVAHALGDESADALMSRVAAAARTIAWTSDDTWRRTNASLRGPLKRIVQRNRTLSPGVVLRDGEVVIEPDHPIASDAVFALRVAVGAAHHSASIERKSLERLATEVQPFPDPWPAEARTLLAALLASGAAAVRVIEALDQRDVWTRIIPEWEPVRARPQRNAYHRFTVDRHLLEATAIASQLTDRVTRPDLLLVGTMLHDLGKGYPGDHTAAGIDLMTAIATRMGFDSDDVASLAKLVELHLLLPDVATRRDLDDPATIVRVAETVASVEELQLLAALTEADSRATGPAAWGPWKAELVSQLVDRVAHVLAGGDATAIAPTAFPTAEQLARLAESQQLIDARDNLLTVMTVDRPGVFSRVAGVLALHGLDVLTANAYSSDEGRALAEFRVHNPFRAETPWAKVVAQLELALDGKLALNARVAERAHTYSTTRPKVAGVGGASVTFDIDASSESTVIDVHAPDAVGVLYRITRALAELDLDIRSAKVHTLGNQVVDAFYVRDRTGSKITDRFTLAEIERAILYSLGP